MRETKHLSTMRIVAPIKKSPASGAKFAKKQITTKFPLLFPPNSKNLKSLDIGLHEGGGNKMFKWSEHMKKKKVSKTVHCKLHTAHYTLPTAHCKLNAAHCTMHTAHWK